MGWGFPPSGLQSSYWKTREKYESHTHTHTRVHVHTHTPGHVLDALSSVVLVVAVARDVLQVVHVGSYQDGPELHEVAVGRVFHCKTGKGTCGLVLPR